MHESNLMETKEVYTEVALNGAPSKIYLHVGNLSGVTEFSSLSKVTWIDKPLYKFDLEYIHIDKYNAAAIRGDIKEKAYRAAKDTLSDYKRSYRASEALLNSIISVAGLTDLVGRESRELKEYLAAKEVIEDYE